MFSRAKLAGCLGFLLTFSGAALAQNDLSAIKTYLLGKTEALVSSTGELGALSQQYYELAKAADFNYEALWAEHQAEVSTLLLDARDAWTTASPLYEQMEGIVAGTPSLAQYDVDIDAGAAADEDPENAVSFDITLPDGQVLEKPGNLMGVTESTLYGTFTDYSSGIQADLNGDGKMEFSDLLPDANVLVGGAEKMAAMARDLSASAKAWEPTESDAFTALIVMVPTMNEYFASWRDSRFVEGGRSNQRDFVAVSRLADIQNILGGLQIVLKSVSPQIATVDAAQSEQLAERLVGLKSYISKVYNQEKLGKRFSPEEADLLGVEAQDRATAITGQLAQVAGALGVTVEN